MTFLGSFGDFFRFPGPGVCSLPRPRDWFLLCLLRPRPLPEAEERSDPADEERDDREDDRELLLEEAGDPTLRALSFLLD